MSIKMWWLLFFISMVYADDDEWFAGSPQAPPESSLEQTAKKNFAWSTAAAAAALDENMSPGYYQYRYARLSEIDESLFLKCYNAGHGPPIKYPHQDTIWDAIN